jgi:hypothetical protein
MKRINGVPQSIPSSIEVLREPKKVEAQFNKMFSKNIQCRTQVVTLEKVVPTCLLGDEDVAKSTYYQTTV